MAGRRPLAKVGWETRRIRVASRGHRAISAMNSGFGPTAAGYFLQGALKFGGYEFFKQQSINALGYE
jgi:hypothetical protein